ncbi:MAG: TolB family protein, partial [Planctomycetota bacterium]
DLDETGRFDLYVNALVAGAMPFRLTPNMGAGGDVMMLQWLPDSKRIAFLGDHNVDNDVSAFVVNVDGTHLVQLNPTLAAEGDVYAMAVVGDGEWMVFAADGETNGVTGYYAVHTDGVGDWIALAGPPSAVSPLVWWFNPDGSITIANNGDGAAWTVELEYLPAAIVALAPPAPPARGDMN